MLDKTYKNPAYKEITAELKKHESTFNWEIYFFDELIKQEKTLKIIEFIKEQLLLILETPKWKKVVIRLIKWEEDYFASVVNINTHSNTTWSENKKTFLFDDVSDFRTIKLKDKVYNKENSQMEEIDLEITKFIWEIEWKKSYILRYDNKESSLLLDYRNKTYTTFETDFNKVLPSLEDFLNKKKTDSKTNQFNINI